MPKAIRYTLLSVRDLLASAGPFIVLAVLLLVLTYLWMDPNPPHHVRLATGPAQSAYEEFGHRYAKALAVHHIEVQLVPSAGSSENLRMLRAGTVDLGFVQGGSRDLEANMDSGLESLGSLFVEPVWLFYSEKSARKVTATATLTSMAQLKGLRVNIGAKGSGVTRLINQMLEVNHIDPAEIQSSRLDQTSATVAFLNGEIDAIVFASAPESLMVQMLLQTPGVKLLDFPQSEAYARRFSFLTPVVLPRGVVDIAGNVPPADMRLVATTTSMIVQARTHPALLQLFSQASLAIHGGANWFSHAREFPNPANTEFPLAPEADRLMRNGVPLLQRYLPFDLANLVERMWLALGIIVAILLPLGRIVPPLYQFRIRSRVFRWYGQLRDIESRVEHGSKAPPELIKELDNLEHRVGKITLPLSYTDELYALRSNINLIRSKLLGKEENLPTPIPASGN